METSDGKRLAPPWEFPDLNTEEGMRIAQEYFFQTHATHARMIAEARNAHGVSKSFIRRKLTREMGDDFKMYTGSNVGDEDAAEASKGIRGELNDIIRHIYTKISPQKPPTSPAHEDATILRHPQGALEVCYAMVVYFKILHRNYASLASNKRLVLKSVMDEELFKWVWRMTVNYPLCDQDFRINIIDENLLGGMSRIPREMQVSPRPQKLMDVGMYLLSNFMKESHLRFPLGFYFVTYLRMVQSNLLSYGGTDEVDSIYDLITRRLMDDPVDEVLVAIDVLMNRNGDSLDSFDEVLQDEERDMHNFIPNMEIDFIRQYDEYVDPRRIAGVLKRIIPDVRQEVQEGGSHSMMPLLLLLRILPSAPLDLVLYKLPGPILVMIRNRIINGQVDEVSKTLLERIDEMMEVRKKRGETYNISSSPSRAPAFQGQMSTARPASSRSGASPASVHPPSAASPSPAAPSGAPGAGGAAPSTQADATAARADATAAQADATATQAGPTPDTAFIPTTSDNIVNERLILAWRAKGNRVEVITISPWEIYTMVGKELRFIMPWVVIALKTGQIYNMPSSDITKEVVEKLLNELMGLMPDELDPQLNEAQIKAFIQQAKGASATRFLQMVVKVGKAYINSLDSGSIGPTLDGLGDKLGANLASFLKDPGHMEYRDYLVEMTPREKNTISMLQKIVRSQ